MSNDPKYAPVIYKDPRNGKYVPAISTFRDNNPAFGNNYPVVAADNVDRCACLIECDNCATQLIGKLDGFQWGFDSLWWGNNISINPDMSINDISTGEQTVALTLTGGINKVYVVWKASKTTEYSLTPLNVTYKVTAPTDFRPTYRGEEGAIHFNFDNATSKLNPVPDITNTMSMFPTQLDENFGFKFKDIRIRIYRQSNPVWGEPLTRRVDQFKDYFLGHWYWELKQVQPGPNPVTDPNKRFGSYPYTLADSSIVSQTPIRPSIMNVNNGGGPGGPGGQLDGNSFTGGIAYVMIDLQNAGPFSGLYVLYGQSHSQRAMHPQPQYRIWSASWAFSMSCATQGAYAQQILGSLKVNTTATRTSPAIPNHPITPTSNEVEIGNKFEELWNNSNMNAVPRYVAIARTAGDPAFSIFPAGAPKYVNTEEHLGINNTIWGTLGLGFRTGWIKDPEGTWGTVASWTFDSDNLNGSISMISHIQRTSQNTYEGIFSLSIVAALYMHGKWASASSLAVKPVSAGLIRTMNGKPYIRNPSDMVQFVNSAIGSVRLSGGYLTYGNGGDPLSPSYYSEVSVIPYIGQVTFNLSNNF